MAKSSASSYPNNYTLILDTLDSDRNSEVTSSNGRYVHHPESVPLHDVIVDNDTKRATVDRENEIPTGRPTTEERELYENEASSEDDGVVSRDKWGRKVEYILSMIGFCVGLGNVWRFPYVCMRNGGGAFLIPFIVCLTVCGLPLYFMEVAMGQFVSLSTFHVWNICPLSKGSCLLLHISMRNDSVSSSEEFWIHNVLQLSSGTTDIGGIPWQSGVALLAQAVMVYLCVIKGVHSAGKVVYVTATLPYILLTILLIKGATLPGALDGVIFYLKPDFSKLFRVQTWVEASIQVFYSLGPAWGGLITMSSYNKFNNNCFRDSLLLCFACEGTSVFAGFTIFTLLGHMAHTLNVPISKFANAGPGLAFVVYPEAISYLPVPQLWGVLFFLMLFTLGLDSQFVFCETFLTTVTDVFPWLMKRRQFLFKILFFTVLFVISLPFATEVNQLHVKSSAGGMYLFQLVDWYFAAYVVIVDSILELFVVSWIYGAERFYDDIQLMLGYRPPYIFAIFWRFLTPLFLMTVLVNTLRTYGPPVYKDYHYSQTEVAIGWCLATVSFLPVPIFALYMLVKTPGSFIQRLKITCRPSRQWVPAEPKLRDEYRAESRQKQLCTFPVPCLGQTA
ncbi:sodium- and chloride-dependent neutral and basic amino acid transporter B(0+) [Aplysia californica]|uniref:Transporter n=1 Tax=Aplysia californica TaxID=6500 RepID=A0ABM1VS31_APLCA|nr:sodium- and chloride-dependent neutral and basic amino acid transporter B(0+) [Aplysia californica]